MIITGDSLQELKLLEPNSVDSVVTDPPYGLSFMGKTWDYDVPTKELWTEVLRVLKPGGYLLAFAGTRTQHRMAVNIEDAGFEIRDMIMYIYGSGFPKSLNIFKQMTKRCECGMMEAYDKDRNVSGLSDKQEAQPRVRPVPNTDIPQTLTDRETEGEVLQSGVSEQDLSSDGRLSKQVQLSEGREEPSVEGRGDLQATKGQLQRSEVHQVSREVSTNGEERRIHNGTQASNGSTHKQTTDENGSGTPRGSQPEQQQDTEPCAFCKQWYAQAIRTHGFGTAIKPSCEPITVARKPISEKNVANNVLEWGTGGINIDGSRIGSEERINQPASSLGNSKTMDGGKANPDKEATSAQGRFPANLIHDGSDEVVGLLGEPARFFYCAKASKSERNKGAINTHATVKPLKLMQYLVKLVTPVGGVCLDPFNGSGTTGIACKLEGFEYIGVELDPEYVKLSEARIDAWTKENTLDV